MTPQADLFGGVPAVNTEQNALGFLVKFASNRRGESFSSEQVTIAAEAMGIVPLALGGTNTDGNMQLLRSTCNQKKHAKHPVDFMQQRGFLL